MSLYLKDSWISALRAGVRTNLRDVGRGWFNLQECDWEVYQVSKLKKLVEMIKFNMQVSTIVQQQNVAIWLVVLTAYWRPCSIPVRLRSGPRESLSLEKQQQTRRSQHSRECINTRRHFFDFDLWPFDPKINEFPGIMVELVCVEFRGPSCVGLWDIMLENKQTPVKKHNPATTVGVSDDGINTLIKRYQLQANASTASALSATVVVVWLVAACYFWPSVIKSLDPTST